MQSITTDIPLSLYLHFPWCKKKCPYCDFNSHVEKSESDKKKYLEILLADIQHELDVTPDRKLISVYCGGGTPSLFSPENMQRIIEKLEQSGRLQPGAEITLEANPGTIERGKFAAYRAAGINRVSLGAQSFDATMLQAIGRIHGVSEIYKSVEEIHAAEIENFNIDLMFGLPGQSLPMAQLDLVEATRLEPAHISRYQLTLEPNTLFHAHPPALPDDDLTDRMEVAGHEFLAEQDFIQYEVSAWSVPERKCQHNLNYWQFGDYLGAGAGAHGKISAPLHTNCHRRVKPRNPDDYMGKNGMGRQMSTSKTITGLQLAFEFFLNSLRLNEGVELSMFEARTGLHPDKIQRPIEEAVRKELLTVENEFICPTHLGRRFLNDLQAIFLP